jgi:CcmD family protein
MGALLVNEVTALFIVGSVTLVVWIGIFAYLWRLDRRVRMLEHDLERQEPE